MQELSEAQKMQVAKHALEMLWNDAIAVKSPSRDPGRDAFIIRNLIEVVTGTPIRMRIPMPCHSVYSHNAL